MKLDTFEELQAQIQELYQTGDYRGTLELATLSTDRFPEHAALLYYWQICMTARLEQIEVSLGLLNDVLSSEIWYGEVLLRKSPSLKSLQGVPEFELLVEKNLQLQKREQEQIYPLITLRPKAACQEGDIPCPLLVGLHGNASTAQASVEYWKPAANAGWLVAIPQSSQAMWKDAYVWDNLDITREELQRHLNSLQTQYAIDPDQIVIAGQSMGGEVAIWLALSSAIEVSGFIAIRPEGPLMEEPDNWQPWIENALGRTLRGTVVIGDEDTQIHQGNIRTLVDLLNEGGIACELEIIPGVGYDFDLEYEAALLRGLGDILEN